LTDPQESRFVSDALTGATPPVEELDATPSVSDQVLLSDAQTRKVLSRQIMNMFVIVNGFTLVLLAGLVLLDQYDLAVRLVKPGDRLVGEQVLIALLGATTVQLGTIAVIMARYVFKAPG